MLAAAIKKDPGMKCYTFILLLLIFSRAGLCQHVKWEGASNWRLYNTFPRIIDYLVADSLHSFPSTSLDSETICRFVRLATLVPKEKTVDVAWMGWYWVSYELNHSVFIFRISNYGGFYLDENRNIYYEIPAGERKDWLSYFSNQAVHLEGTK